MKTKRVFEKTSRLWMPLSVFLLTLVMAVSCQQEGEDMHNEENDRATELQLWLAKNYPDATFSVDWAKHSEYVAEGYTISRVAVISSVGEYGINRQAAAENKDERYLNHPVWLEALHGNSGEILNAYIYAVIPSVAYMENHSFSYDDIGLYNLKDFEGDMPMYRLDGAPIQLKIFADGKHVKDILPTKSKSIDNEGGIFAKRMGSGGGGEWPSCKNYHGG